MLCAFFSSCNKQGLRSKVAVHGHLIVVASLVAQHGFLETQVSVVVAHGLSSWRSQALEHRCMGLVALWHVGILPNQAGNPCLLHWQVNSLPLSHLGSPLEGISSVQFLTHIRLFATPWTAARQASLSITNSQSLLKLMSSESVMPSNHLIFCCPLLLPPSIFPSIRVFSNESVLRIKWPKYWSFNFSISPSDEHSGLISFSMDWLNLLSVQGTPKSLLQHHSSKASILRHSAFFIVQLSHPYMTTGKTIALTRWTFVGKVMSLLFNMLSGLVITFLPRSKRLLISLLQLLSAVGGDI